MCQLKIAAHCYQRPQFWIGSWLCSSQTLLRVWCMSPLDGRSCITLVTQVWVPFSTWTMTGGLPLSRQCLAHVSARTMFGPS